MLEKDVYKTIWLDYALLPPVSEVSLFESPDDRDDGFGK